MAKLKRICSTLATTVIAVIIILMFAVMETACNACSTAEEPPKATYTITFNLNGGFLPGGNTLEFEENTEVILPQNATRLNYIFDGWFDNDGLTGESYTKIDAANANSDKEFWAKWKEDQGEAHDDSPDEGHGDGQDTPPDGGQDTPPEGQGDVQGGGQDTPPDGGQGGEQGDGHDEGGGSEPTPTISPVILHLNGGSIKEGYTNFYNYVEGTVTCLPQIERLGYTFGGWFDNEEFNGNAVTEIPADATGEKHYYAKWIEDVVQKTVKYTVIFDLNYPDSPAPETEIVTEGDLVAEPDEISRPGYKFVGWFLQSVNGTKYNFLQPVMGNLNLYAHWEPEIYGITYELFGGTINDGNVTSYTYGSVTKLPTDVTKENSVFVGWYENENFEGEAITEITETSIGDKKFYACWKEEPQQPEEPDVPEQPDDPDKPNQPENPDEPKNPDQPEEPENDFKITASGGYEEGAFVEVPLLADTTAADYAVFYKASDDRQYTAIDQELVRVNNNVVRANILGLSAGQYSIQVVVNGKKAITTVSVAKHDRSGYAHWMYYEGIGAYNDDGTLKDGTLVVYVTENNKNTVKARIKTERGEVEYTGIINILQKISTSVVPVVVRVIGSVAAPQWKRIEYANGGEVLQELTINQTLGSTEDIIKNNLNTLEDGIEPLDNIGNKLIWQNNEYTCEWNNCTISGANNVTIEGIGTDATIYQWGLTWYECSSIEIRNLTFEGYPGDACSFTGNKSSANRLTNADNFTSKYFWLHNCTFNSGKNNWDVTSGQDMHNGGVATEFKYLSYATESYVHYNNTSKTCIVGEDDISRTASLTFHNNYYDNSALPLCRQANIHMYNNYFGGSTDYGLSIRAGCYAFIENCYFDGLNNPITTQDGNNKKGIAKVYQSVFNKNIGYDYLNKTVFVVNSRTQTVQSDNIFGENFDISDGNFYYDSSKKATRLDFGFTMLTAEQVKTEVPKLAGVHKN